VKAVNLDACHIANAHAIFLLNAFEESRQQFADQGEWDRGGSSKTGGLLIVAIMHWLKDQDACHYIVFNAPIGVAFS
jgi:hypothetical protein